MPGQKKVSSVARELLRRVARTMMFGVQPLASGTGEGTVTVRVRLMFVPKMSMELPSQKLVSISWFCTTYSVTFTSTSSGQSVPIDVSSSSAVAGELKRRPKRTTSPPGQ